VFVLLLVCAAAVAFLLLQTGGKERAASRRHEGGGVASDAARADEPRGDDATRTSKAAGGAAAATDDDPNRVPGADLVLTGRVVRDGVGVPGATVVAQRAYPAERSSMRWMTQSFDSPPPPIAKTSSAEGGRFEVRIPRRSRVFLRAAKAGSGSASLFLLMPPAGDPPEVTLNLRPGSGIGGIVVNEKGDPVKDAAVALELQDWNRSVGEMPTQTDENGRFAIQDVPDGSFRVKVQAAGYPETRHWINVPSQAFVRIELRPAGVVVGKVTDSGGAAIAGARVLITTSAWESAGMGGSGRAESDESGAYRIEIYPGSVQTAAVEHPRYGRQVAGADSFDLPTGLVESGKELKYPIKLKPGVPVHGRAVYLDTQAGAAGASITLLRMARQWRGMSDVDVVRADDEGRFEFPYVLEGTYALEAKGEKGARLPTRYAQGNQPVTIDFFVDGETTPPEQKVELIATGGVHGRILGLGEPDPSQRLGVFIQASTGYQSGTVDDLGTFEITHVPVMEDAVVQSNSPPAKSDPFRIEAGKVAEVTLDASKKGLAGIVQDEAGNPVAGARVYLSPQNQVQGQLQRMQQGGWGATLTDSAGRFTVGAGQWDNDYWKSQKFVAIATRRDYTVAMSDPFDLPQEGDAAPNLRLVLREGGFVRGHVEFAGGAPAVNVPVSLSPKPDPNAPMETRSPQSAYSDLDGRFEIKGLGDGVYIASAYHALGKVETREVRAGDEDVKLTIEPALAIAGVVVTESGSPVVYAQVSALVPTATGEQPQTTQTQANGRFRIGQLAAGSYAVEASPNTQYWAATASFEKKRVEGIAAGTEDLVIVVPEGKGLRGKVEDRRGQPVAGAGVIAMPIQLEAQPQPGRAQQAMQMQQQSRPSAVTNGRGEFEIKGLGTAEVELLAVASGYMPATEKAVAGGAPVILRLDPGEVIEGQLLKADGTPAARQWLWLQPITKETQDKLNDWQQRGGQAWNNLGGWSLQSGTTDALGHFRFASLIAGEYRCQAQPSTDEILPLATLRTGMPSVTLRYERALTIRGRVTGPGGQPLVLQQGTRVQIAARSGEQWFPGAMVGEDGRFELRGMPPGTVTLQLWAGNDYKPATVEVASGSDGVQITLERNQPQPKPAGK